MIFVAIFFFSIMLMHFAHNNYINGKRYHFLILISIMILIITATIRSVNVGNDVHVYQYPLYKLVLRSKDFLTYYKRASWITNDRLYLVLVFFCGRVFKSINSLFFFEELFVLAPIYYVIWKCKEYVNPVYSLMAYECLFYLETYNVIRQHIAIAFVVLGFFFYFEKRNVTKYVFWSLIAVGMHQSAAIFIIYPVLRHIIEVKNKKNKRILIAGIVLIIAVLSFYYRPILRFLLSVLSFLPSRYGGKRYLGIEKPNFPDVDMTVTILGTVLLVLSKKNEPNDKRIDWLLLMNYIMMATCYFTMMAEFGSRILWYFKIFNIFSFGYGSKLISDDSTSRILYFICIYIVLSFYWIYIYLISGSAGVFPYEIVH